MPGFLRQLPRRAFLMLMAAGAAMITASSLVYFDFEALPPFVVEKLPLAHEALYMVALRAHVAAALLAFPLCIALMTRTLQRRAAWHRWIGRVAGVAVLFVLVPSGAVLAMSAKGGAFVSAGFLLSGAIIAYAMVRGVAGARRRDLATHARAMRHVFAQMTVAVTSRALLVALDIGGVDPDLAYVIGLWGPVLASAAAAELASPSLAHLTRRIRREISSALVRVRVRPLARSAARVGR